MENFANPRYDWAADYGIVVPGQYEIISQTLFDRQTVTSAAAQTVTFFQSATIGTINGNMDTAGQLAAGNSFLVRAMRLAMLPDVFTIASTAAGAAASQTSSYRDAFILGFGSFFEFRVGEKRYGTFLTMTLPGAMGVFGHLMEFGFAHATNYAGVSHGMNGPPDIRSAYTLSRPIAIPPLFPFRGSLVVPTALTFSSGNMPVICVLDGELRRPVQ